MRPIALRAPPARRPRLAAAALLLAAALLAAAPAAAGSEVDLAKWTGSSSATAVTNGSVSYYRYGAANSGLLTPGTDFYGQRSGVSSPSWSCTGGQCNFLGGWNGSPNADNYLQWQGSTLEYQGCKFYWQVRARAHQCTHAAGKAAAAPGPAVPAARAPGPAPAARACSQPAASPAAGCSGPPLLGARPSAAAPRRTCLGLALGSAPTPQHPRSPSRAPGRTRPAAARPRLSCGAPPRTPGPTRSKSSALISPEAAGPGARLW